MAAHGGTEISQAFDVLQKAVQATAQGTPAILQLLEGLSARADRMIMVTERILASQMVQEAVMTRSMNVSQSFTRPEGPFKIVKSVDGQDPMEEPWNLPGLWYRSSVQNLSLEDAVKYLDFYGVRCLKARKGNSSS